jgi:hypothetical protein
MNVQQNVDLIPIETASPQLHHQKVLIFKQPPSKKIKLFKLESNDKKLKSTSFTLEDSSKLNLFHKSYWYPIANFKLKLIYYAPFIYC